MNLWKKKIVIVCYELTAQTKWMRYCLIINTTEHTSISQSYCTHLLKCVWMNSVRFGPPKQTPACCYFVTRLAHTSWLLPHSGNFFISIFRSPLSLSQQATESFSFSFVLDFCYIYILTIYFYLHIFYIFISTYMYFFLNSVLKAGIEKQRVHKCASSNNNSNTNLVNE